MRSSAVCEQALVADMHSDGSSPGDPASEDSEGVRTDVYSEVAKYTERAGVLVREEGGTADTGMANTVDDGKVDTGLADTDFALLALKLPKTRFGMTSLKIVF